MNSKELTIRQIGEFCASARCSKCPVKKWNEESGLHNGCMESLRLPEVSEIVLNEINKTFVSLSTLNPGEIFKIGEHDFIVLEQKPGQTMVISKGFMAEAKKFDNNTRDYNKSSLKELIESEIQPVIENMVGTGNLIEHEVDLTSVDMQNEFGTCRCKVRPITFDEARKYNDLIVNKDLTDWWWTCTPWSTEERGLKYSIAVVSSSGNVGRNCCDDGFDGVRPVCILKSNIFIKKE